MRRLAIGSAILFVALGYLAVASRPGATTPTPTVVSQPQAGPAVRSETPVQITDLTRAGVPGSAKPVTPGVYGVVELPPELKAARVPGHTDPTCPNKEPCGP
jgi:hypothetical protein